MNENPTEQLSYMAYRCKFCGRDGVAQYDPACGPLRLERWAAMLSCNRCAGYHTKRLRLEESIWQTCYALVTIMDRSNDQSVRNDALNQARQLLSQKTKSYAAHICDFFNKATIWEPDFVALLIESPRRCHEVLSHYQRGVR